MSEPVSALGEQERRQRRVQIEKIVRRHTSMTFQRSNGFGQMVIQFDRLLVAAERRGEAKGRRDAYETAQAACVVQASKHMTMGSIGAMNTDASEACLSCAKAVITAAAAAARVAQGEGQDR